MQHRVIAALVTALIAAGAGEAHASPVAPVDMSCLAPAGDPQVGSPEWVQRDLQNIACSTYRVRDQALSPAFGVANLAQGGALYAEQWTEQLQNPAHPKGGLTTLIPGSKAADAFRTIKRWTEAGRGRVAPVTFKADNGSTLRGHVFAPPSRVKRPAGGFPGVVITDGSVQAYEELYFWAAEDLAEHGYLVMTYDVQGQGDSDLLGSDCPGACSGVPYQQDYNFFQGAEDSLSFFLSEKNPFDDVLDADRVALAGHSLGASAVSTVGQCDNRVRTIVAWDNLRRIDSCNGVRIAPQNRTAKLINVPALALTNDYLFTPEAHPGDAPDPHAKDAGYQQIKAAGLDAQIVTFRNATHLTYSYIPLVLPANELSERMASFYTLAWLDLHLKGDRTALKRLTAQRFDDSVDVSSIGAGVFDPALANSDDLTSGNVPYVIKGISVKDAVSFYYLSSYALKDPAGSRTFDCPAMRVGCPVADLPPVTAKKKAAAKKKKRRSARRR